MADSSRAARDELRDMLKGAWSAAGRMRFAELTAESGIPPRTLAGWVEGRAVPSAAREPGFWSVVEKLQRVSGSPAYAHAEWEAALRAARNEAESARKQVFPKQRPEDSGLRFVRLHRCAPDTSAVEVRGRTDERAVMNAFVRDSHPDAPSYLCWQADAPVGKTVLLADYVRRRLPADADIVSFFVSAAHGTDTRAAFEAEIVGQIDDFLGRTGRAVPSNVRGWKALFAEAAEKSACYGRKLLLLVDGLDDDVAWSGLAAGSGTPGAGADGADGADAKGPSGTGRRPVRGSIAALLPSRPPPNMRVIVSLRRYGVLPDDVPQVRHPLSRSRHLRTLVPVPGVPLVREPPPDVAALGEPVAGLLAVAGGGLRTKDLADLAGLPAEHLDRLTQGPSGRALVTDDPLFGTYALADHRLLHAVREDLGEAGVLRHTRALLAWSRLWRASGWPDDTPPYPLTHQLRLLTDTAERAAYILDMPRLRRLARTAGPDAALAQLDSFETEITGWPQDGTPGGDTLAALVPLSAARSLLHQDTHDVPAGAASLLVRLGDVERALGLARSAPTAVARAVHLADVAVELAYAGQADLDADADADAVVREAVLWLVRDRADQGFPGTFRDPERLVRLLGAARTLATLKGPEPARPLLRAVLQDPTAGTETLIEAAGMLDSMEDGDVAAVLHDRAWMLGAGGMRARAAAVDLWGASARATPSFSTYAGDRIEAICEELGDADGLGAIDVLATAASALNDLPAKRSRSASVLTRRALDRLRRAIEALRDPDSLPGSLSEDDQGHLRRELAGTLARLTKAVADTGVVRDDLDDIGRLLEDLPEGLRIGVLGDALPERAQWVFETAQEERAREDGELAAAADEKRRAKRREKDAGNKTSNERQELYRRVRRKQGSAAAAQAVKRAEEAQEAQAEPEAVRRPPPIPHRRSAGLPPPGGGPHPDHPDHPHFALLPEADDQLGAGNHLRSRELLETALRNRAAAWPPTSASGPALPADWTAELCQAMGTAGLSDEAEALALSRPDPQDRARHLAALSLGCSLAEHDDLGTSYARAAARLMSDGAAPGPANAVAQALAHTGDEPAASAMARGDTAPQRRQALTAVAAGLVRHCPEGAARVAAPLVEALARRIEAGAHGSPRIPLTELAALLLAYPDVRHPAPRLSDGLHRAAHHVAAPSMAQPAQPMAVLTLLARLGCLPEDDTYAVASSTDRWRRSLRPGQGPAAELALLAALDGDTAAVRRHTDAQRDPEARSTALRTAAVHLAGAQTTLTPDHDAADRAIRTCLALARTCDDGGPPAEATARDLALRLLRSDAWTHTIPLLPPLAPAALGRLGAMTWDISRLR